jgi:hypothetical protein
VVQKRKSILPCQALGAVCSLITCTIFSPELVIAGLSLKSLGYAFKAVELNLYRVAILLFGLLLKRLIQDRSEGLTNNDQKTYSSATPIISWFATGAPPTHL